MDISVASAAEALDFFTHYVLSNDEKRRIAKLILFGSLLDGEAGEDSDIDLFVVALDNLAEVSELCADASLETMFRYGKRVEPIVGCIDRYLHQDSYFFREVLKGGKEIYSMPEEEVKRGEARNFLLLALEYLEQSRPNLELGHFRLTVDGAYNVIELCAKGLWVLKGQTVPRRHGSIVQAFSELYVKGGDLPRDIGRGFSRGLELRNRARYEYYSEITRLDAEAMLTLADELVKVLEDKLAEQENTA